MLIEGKMYLFMTLSYFFSGRVVTWNPGHAVLTDAQVHYEDVGDLDVFERGTGKFKELPHGINVPLPGTIIMPLS